MIQTVDMVIIIIVIEIWYAFISWALIYGVYKQATKTDIMVVDGIIQAKEFNGSCYYLILKEKTGDFSSHMVSTDTYYRHSISENIKLTRDNEKRYTNWDVVEDI